VVCVADAAICGFVTKGLWMKLGKGGAKRSVAKRAPPKTLAETQINKKAKETSLAELVAKYAQEPTAELMGEMLVRMTAYAQDHTDITYNAHMLLLDEEVVARFPQPSPPLNSCGCGTMRTVQWETHTDTFVWLCKDHSTAAADHWLKNKIEGRDSERVASDMLWDVPMLAYNVLFHFGSLVHAIDEMK
jgi:hypothetical protein